MTGSLPVSDDRPAKKRKPNYTYTEDSDDISVADSLPDTRDGDGADYSYQPSESGSTGLAHLDDFRAPAPPMASRTISAPEQTHPASPVAGLPQSQEMPEQSPFFMIQDPTFPTHPHAPQTLPTHYMTHGRRHTVADLKSIQESVNYGHQSAYGHTDSHVSRFF